MKPTFFPSNKWFTIPELLVGITILAVLWTIGVVSFSWYSQDARDTARKTDITNLERVLGLHYTSRSQYPSPSEAVDISYSWATLWSQGVFWTQSQAELGKIFWELKDPKYGNQYTYGVTSNKSEYQLWVLFENQQKSLNPFAFDISSPDLIPTTYASTVFDPLELSPLIWLDATDIDGDWDDTDNPSNGSTSVSSWINKSSAWASNNPTLTHWNMGYHNTGFDSSYPGVYIDRNRWLLLNNSDITQGDIFYVVQNEDPFGDTDENGLALQSSNSNKYWIGFWWTRRDALRINNSPKFHNKSPSTSSYRTYPFIYGFHTDNSNYSFRDTWRLISQGATSSISWQEWAFNRAWANNSRADFVVSEILIFSTALSTVDRQKVEWYLAHKWWQEWYLSDSHPFKDSPPESTGPPPPVDATPDTFTLSDITDANLSTQYISNTISVTGINTDASISISGGSMSINNAAFSTGSTTVSQWDTVRVQLISADTSDTVVWATLNIWSVTDTFTVRTFVADTTPDTFTFSPVVWADLATSYTSNTIIVSWLNTQVPISITGVWAEYRISDGIPYDTTWWWSASASSTYSWNDPDDAFDNNTGLKWWWNNGAFPARLNYDFGVWGDELVTKYTLYRSSSQEWWWNSWKYSPSNWTFEWSDDNSNWEVLDTQTNESISAGATKKEYSFSNTSFYRYYRINISSASHSNTSWVNITEMELINEDGQWLFTSSAWTVENGDIVDIRMTSWNTPGNTKTASLSVWSETSNYVISTVAADSSPNDFSFLDETDANTSTQYTRLFTVSGINVPTSISVTAGTWVFEINNSGTDITSWTVDNWDIITLKNTSPSSASSSNNTELTIGDKSAIFTISTPAPPSDPRPDTFAFTDVSNASLNQIYESNIITVSGINVDIPISITWWEYEINDSGIYTSSSANVSSGDQISVRTTSSSSPANTVDVVLRIWSWSDQVTDTFSVTTIPPDTEPDSFTFGSITDANINEIYNSNPVTILWINTQTSVTISWNGSFNINGWAYVTSWNINNWDTITVRLQAGSSWGWDTQSTTLTVGTGPNNSSTFTVSTGSWDIIPDSFVFNDILDANLNSLYYSDTITISGINAPTDISIVGGFYRIGNSWEFTSNPWQVENGDEITVRLISSINWSTSTSASLNIWGLSDSFDVTTLPFVSEASPASSVELTNVNVFGNYNGLIVHGTNEDTHYVFAAPSLITTDLTDTDIMSIHNNSKFVYNNFNNIPASYSGNNLTMTWWFDFRSSSPLLYSGSKEDLWSYGWLQQVDAGVRSTYRNFPAYYAIADKLDNFWLWYVETILSESIGINPIKPYYCNDILQSKLIYNIAPEATITASPTDYNSYGTSWIANGIKSAEGDLDYEYHSDSGNAFISFEWETLKNIWYVKIFNRTWCCSDRLTWAVIKLYNTSGDIIYSHALWDTTDDFVIDLDLEWIWQMHFVKTLTIESVGWNFLNLREVEIYTGWNLKDGEYKVDRDGAGGLSPYNVYCDMTTDGWGWTRIGEDYVSNGTFTNQQHIWEHTFTWYDNASDNRIVSQSIQSPPSYLSDVFVMQHNGSNSEYYELYFPEIPGSFFAQEIRLSLWVKGWNSWLFSHTIDYKDGSTQSGITDNFEQVASDGDWIQYLARIPLNSEVDTFSWKIWEGTTGFYFTGAQMEIYYK